MNGPETDHERWNRKYRDNGPESYGSGPTEWLAAHRDLLDRQPRGRALDVACGNGRNALYLARLGFEVDALDVSDVVVDWLTEQVRREGAAVHPRVCDLTREPLPRRRYQVVVNFNFLERRLFPALEDALVPGGLLVFETFTRGQIGLPRGPSTAEHTLAPGELRRAFAGLEILDEREATLHADDPVRKREVASLVARRAAVEPAEG